MTKTDDRVMQMVVEELAKNPGASVGELFDKAKVLNASIGQLTHRQFHARYPLQVKRRAGAGKRSRKARKTATKEAGGRGRGRRKGSPSGGGREAVRQVFLQFAQELVAAEARKDLVKVLLQVDSYVDDAIRLAGK